jgi:hypothetical protein
MIFHRILERRLQSEEAFVDSGWIVAVERDHPGSRLAASDHLERIRLDPGNDGPSVAAGEAIRTSMPSSLSSRRSASRKRASPALVAAVLHEAYPTIRRSGIGAQRAIEDLLIKSMGRSRQVGDRAWM